MTAVEEDTELRDLILQNLESNGVIGKIKAELRSSIFLALEDEGSFKSKIPIYNKKLKDFVARPEGKIVVSLVRDFLQYFNLNFTLAVFDPEVVPSADYFSGIDLLSRLGLNGVHSDSSLLGVMISRALKCECMKTDRSNDFEQLDKAQENTASSSVYSDSFFMANKSKPKVSDLVNEEDTIIPKGVIKDSDDPFFDEPLPLEKKSLFSFNKDNQSTPKETADKISDNQGHSMMLEKGQEKGSLSSLRDLPSLNSKNNEVPVWGMNRATKKPLPSLGVFDSNIQEGDYDEEEFNSSASGQSTKSSLKSTDIGGLVKLDSIDNQDNSEQSIEEDIDEDLSAGVDDLLNSSLSLGDDATTDQTVSQISVPGVCDYVESCDNAK